MVSKAFLLPATFCCHGKTYLLRQGISLRPVCNGATSSLRTCGALKTLGFAAKWSEVFFFSCKQRPGKGNVFSFLGITINHTRMTEILFDAHHKGVKY